MPPRATVIVPASNEAGYIGACLEAVQASETAVPFETIVVANGCTDDTAVKARSVVHRPDRPVRIIDTPEGGKLRALQTGDEAARAPLRLYLDADVIVSSGLIGALIAALEGEGARYASGTPRIAPPRSAVTRAYARFWQQLSFFTTGVPGFGLFAMNAEGRARWGDWPDIVSDDTFARLNFAPNERHIVSETYSWPMIEGLSALVRVRRRQDRGVREIARRFPELMRNTDRGYADRARKARAALRDPSGFVVYGLVALCVRLVPASGGWVRGR